MLDSTQLSDNNIVMPHNHYHKPKNKISVYAKRENRYQHKLAAEKHTLDVFNSGMRLETPSQQFIALLLMTNIVISIASDINTKKHDTASIVHEPHHDISHQSMQPNTEKTTNTLWIQPDENVLPENCTYIRNTFLRIKQQLPDSTQMINRIFKDNTLVMSCVKKEKIQSAVSDSMAKALYSSGLNSIFYPPREPKNKETFMDYVLHHESLHYDTANRHSTFFCNPELTRKQLNNSEIELLTTSPIWPPTKENLLLFEEIVNSDMKSDKLAFLYQLNRNRFDNTLTPDEQQSLEAIESLLENAILYTEEFPISRNPELIEKYQKNPKDFSQFITEKGYIIFHDLKLVHSTDGPQLNGYIKDKISMFLQGIRSAVYEYNKYYEKNIVRGFSEFDTHVRTGMPDTIIQEFFPKLYAHLQKEEKCCREGRKSACYKP